MFPGCRVANFPRCLHRLKTSEASRFHYSFEEFVDHIKAMRTVREWEYTSRFGHLGSAQTSRANSARVVEYFSDSYQDSKEAVYKAELFLSVYDYIGRHAPLFSRKDLVEKLDGTRFSVDSALLRAVHYVFTFALQPAATDPKKVLGLARAFKAIELSGQ
jgi:phosphatidylserine decarboxylase